MVNRKGEGEKEWQLENAIVRYLVRGHPLILSVWMKTTSHIYRQVKSPDVTVTKSTSLKLTILQNKTKHLRNEKHQEK